MSWFNFEEGLAGSKFVRPKTAKFLDCHSETTFKEQEANDYNEGDFLLKNFSSSLKSVQASDFQSSTQFFPFFFLTLPKVFRLLYGLLSVCLLLMPECLFPRLFSILPSQVTTCEHAQTYLGDQSQSLKLMSQSSFLELISVSKYCCFNSAKADLEIIEYNTWTYLYLVR